MNDLGTRSPTDNSRLKLGYSNPELQIIPLLKTGGFGPAKRLGQVTARLRDINDCADDNMQSCGVAARLERDGHNFASWVTRIQAEFEGGTRWLTRTPLWGSSS